MHIYYRGCLFSKSTIISLLRFSIWYIETIARDAQFCKRFLLTCPHGGPFQKLASILHQSREALMFSYLLFMKVLPEIVYTCLQAIISLFTLARTIRASKWYSVDFISQTWPLARRTSHLFHIHNATHNEDGLLLLISRQTPTQPMSPCCTLLALDMLFLEVYFPYIKSVLPYSHFL